MFNSKKAFTLVELMIVIAVIGILAVVLIPRLSSSKDSAKNTGVEANIRIIRGLLESMISDYSDKTQLATSLKSKIQSTGIKNPFNGNTSVIDYQGDSSNNAAVMIEVKPDTTIYDANTILAFQRLFLSGPGCSSWSRADAMGSIWVFIYSYESVNKIEAQVIGYGNQKDANGRYLPLTTINNVARISQ